jgi:glutaredoxin
MPSSDSTARVTAKRLCLASTLLVVFAFGCNLLDSAPAASGDATSADEQATEASAPPPSSDVTSLGPGAETRIYYQFIDDRGSVRFVERLQDVPEGWRDRVGYLELDSPPPLSPSDAKRVRDDRYARSNPRPSGGGATSASSTWGMGGGDEPEVLLYYADWCGYCKKARRHLDGKDVEYELLDVDRPAIKEELVQKTGQRGIPVIEINGRVMKGYNAQRLDEMLDEA